MRPMLQAERVFYQCITTDYFALTVRSMERDESDPQTCIWKKCTCAYGRKVETEDQFVFRKQHLFRRDLFASLCIRSRRAKRSVWLKAMIVGGLCVSDQCSKGPDARKIFCAVGDCYAVAFEYVKRRIVNIFAVLFVDSQIHCAKIPAKTNNVPRKPMKVDERSSSNVDRSGGSGGFRQICYSRALRSRRKCSRVVSYYYITNT